MRKNVNRTITTGVVALSLVLGGAGVVAATTAASLPPTSPTSSSSDTGNDTNIHETQIKGTITAPPEVADGVEGSENAADEKTADSAESKALEALATVTADQAKATALTAVPGTAGQVQLEEEDGFVVYQVEITGADGAVTEVIVDAGNGSILVQQVEDANDASDANETPDVNETPVAPVG